MFVRGMIRQFRRCGAASRRIRDIGIFASMTPEEPAGPAHQTKPGSRKRDSVAADAGCQAACCLMEILSAF